MFRLAYNPGNHPVVRELVSDQVADLIEIIFGKLDDTGHFSDINRVREFMVRSEYLCDLVDLTYSNGNGLLKTEISWVEIIKNRYEDILIKVKDQNHEYTFNEIGEGLVDLLFGFFSNYQYPYLQEYGDTTMAFDEDGFLLSMLEKKAYPELEPCLLQAGEVFYDTVVLGCSDDLTEPSDYDRKKFSEYYAELWYDYFFDATNLGLDNYNHTDLFDGIDCTEHAALSGTWNYSVIHDVLFWDGDFLFVMPLLANKKEMNNFVKTVGNYMNYKVISADMAALSTEDTVCSINKDTCETSATNGENE